MAAERETSIRVSSAPIVARNRPLSRRSSAYHQRTLSFSASADPRLGQLVEVLLVPMRVARFRLNRAVGADAITPICRDRASPVVDRPERLIASAVGPRFHFSGHHHRSAAFAIERTEVRALNIIADNARQDIPKLGWAWLGTWDGQTLWEIGFWP
jgi:hypothetical protein